MRRFTRLFERLDGTTRTAEKVAALEAYFRDAPGSDAAWALHFLIGRRLKRAVGTRLLREWVAGETGYPAWLVEESYDAVGDLAETLALLLPEPEARRDAPLHELVESLLLPLREADDATKREMLLRAWRSMDGSQRLVWNKLITGGFRVGVQRTLVARALAGIAGVAPAVMSHRLMGAWSPTAEELRRLIASGDDGADDPARPYPFFLASPLESDPDVLGDVTAWLAEWKWDGIRAQLLRRGDTVMVWSRGEELMTDRFPELEAVARRLPDGTVLDGEAMAWRDDAPLPFGVLQKRIGRKRLGPKILAEAPVAFLAYDLLEDRGDDVRERPIEDRRGRLERIVAAVDAPALRLSPAIDAPDWGELARLRETSRDRLVEGVVLKRLGSPYRAGRVRVDWWKWKVDPYEVDAVLIYAQRGHGRRASLYTDYTFGVWRDGELVPVAKAYSGLTDAEIREVDAFVRRNIVDRFGPVRVVRPELVFELHFEGIRRSSRHKSGIAVRFPRMARWRRDKRPEDADTLAALERLLPGEAKNG